MTSEKQITYTTTNTYSTLNEFTPHTRNVWIACHGLGYLSEYFIRHFRQLDEDTNYIIAPQAPSKYYQDKSYKYIGASWFTRRYLDQEITNVRNYLDEVYVHEILPKQSMSFNLILMGYSQGVSAITRWAALSQIRCSKLLLHSGGIPDELTAKDFEHLKDCNIQLIYGDRDPYITGSRLEMEYEKCKNLWGENCTITKFNGGHEVNEKLILKNAKF